MKNSWLDVAEYVSIAGSIVGSTVAVASQQVAYAATPLSLSLFLNLVNRHRFEQTIAPDATTKITQVDERLSQEVESLRTSLSALPTQTSTTQIISELEKRISPLEAVDLSAIEQQLGELKAEYASLQVVKPETTPNSSDLLLEKKLKDLETAAATLQAQIEVLSEHQSSLPVAPAPANLSSLEASVAKIDGLDQGLSQLGEKVTQLQNTVTQLAVPPKVEESPIATTPNPADLLLEKRLKDLEGAAATLQAQIEVVSEHQSSLPVAPALANLSSLEASVAKIDGLDQGLSQLGEKVTQLQNTVTQLAVPSKVQESPTATTPNPADLLLEKRLKDLEGAAATLQAQIEVVSEHQSSLPVTQSIVSPTQLEQQRVEIEDLIAENWQNSVKAITHVHEVIVESIEKLRQQVLSTAEPTKTSENIGETVAKITEQITVLQSEIAALKTQIAPLESLELESVRQDISHVQKSLIRLETRHLAALQTAIAHLQSNLTNFANETEPEIAAIQQEIEHDRQDPETAFISGATGITDIQGLVNQTVQSYIGEINQQLQKIQPSDYQLVFDRPNIRRIVTEAIDQTKERLIMVCPWLSQPAINQEMIAKFAALLKRNGQIELGWGQLKDIEQGELPIRIDQTRWQINEQGNKIAYNALNDLEELRKKYPHQLKLKILGTNENFLVCDRSFGLVSSYHFLAVDDSFPEREVAVWTSDQRIIEGLINRFEDPLLHPSSADAYRKRGFERLYIGDYPAAIGDYTQAISINGNNANDYNDRGVAHASLGEHQLAIADYQQSIELDAHNPVVYFNQGVARYEMGDVTGAIEDYTQGIKLSPEDAVAYNNRGRARFDLGDRQGAIADYTQALAINPQDAVVYFNRAIARYEITDYHGSIEDFNQALKIHPEYASAYHQRGLARAKTGDLHGALEDVQNAANLFSQQGDEGNYQKAMEALNQLQL